MRDATRMRRVGRAGGRLRPVGRIDVRQEDVGRDRLRAAGEGGVEAREVCVGEDGSRRSRASRFRPGSRVEGVERCWKRGGGEPAVLQQAGGDGVAVGGELVVAEARKGTPAASRRRYCSKLSAQLAARSSSGKTVSASRSMIPSSVADRSSTTGITEDRSAHRGRSIGGKSKGAACPRRRTSPRRRGTWSRRPLQGRPNGSDRR